MNESAQCCIARIATAKHGCRDCCLSSKAAKWAVSAWGTLAPWLTARFARSSASSLGEDDQIDWLGDMQEEINEAKGARDAISPVPVQRIETGVTEPVSGERRHRTDYAGTVWYGGRPQMGRPLPGGDAEITAPFWLPDSHVYEPGAVGEAQVQASAAVQSAWIQSAGGSYQIFEASAALGEYPEHDGGLRVFVAVTAFATLPLGVAYRVTVICAPDLVRRPRA